MTRKTPILSSPTERPAIDYDYYMARARVERAHAFRDALSAIWSTGSAERAPAKPAAGKLAGVNA